MSAPTVGEIELSAWLDGEAPPGRREAVEVWLKANPGAATRVDVWRRQNDLIRARFARVAAEPLPETIWPAPAETARRDAPRGGPNPATAANDAPIRVERFDRARRDMRARLAVVALMSFAAGAAVTLMLMAAR